jgi:hypothetical protein
MKRILTYTLSLVIIFSAVSCLRDSESATSRLLSSVSGASGELVVVTDKTLWDSEEGLKIQEIFQSAVPALPQYEPMFNLLQINMAGFGKLFQNHRNVLFVTIDPAVTESKVTFQTDTYAATQVLFKATGPDAASVLQAIENNKQLIFDKILSTERERWMRYYLRTQSSQNFNRLKDQHGISMPVPAGYQVEESESGFAWIALETPVSTQSVLIHYFKASGSSVFTRDSMMMIRNRLTMTKVPGPKAGSYMEIEERYPVEYKVFNYNGRNYAEIRGLWTLVNGFMGGPFITLMTYDEKNRRAVMLDGFVYAPGEDKRELIRQVEALLYTADFHSPEEAVVIARKPKEKKKRGS